MSKDLRIINNKFIDQTTRISFKFDGKTLYGFKGDTLASALLANNIEPFSTSVRMIPSLKLNSFNIFSHK